MTEVPVPFALLLRGLRTGTGMTQEELAGSAGVSARSVSDLERGAVRTPQKDTVRLLAQALGLSGSALVEFEAAARGHVIPRSVSRGPAAATRTLPRDIASFTGRRSELAALASAAAAAGGVVSIHAIGGMAGVGKTAFAVHAAHQLASRFTGGQIFLPLHGHTPGHQPVDPSDALASLLLITGVPAGQIPADLEARTGLWRDRLAGKPLLLVLDDAANSEQIRPLLPGVGRSLVLVTSRRRLTALEDAQAISLDALPPGEAAGLLVRLAVRPGLSSADPAVAEITRLCGCLPLAIGMLARQLYHHPAWTVAGLAHDLAASVDRLGHLATENFSVTAAFDLSYDDLTPGQQRLFRRLALHPGTEIDRYAAAALGGTGLDEARRGLETLYEHYLLTEPAPGRYRMHDLIREHARALANRLDPAGDREQAGGRLLDYYQDAARRADALMDRMISGDPLTARGTGPATSPVLDGREGAMAWVRAERASLLACLDQATTAGQHARVVALTAGLAGLLSHDGPWDEAIVRHTTAARAARQAGDVPGQARALADLAETRALTGDYPGAARDLQETADLYRGAGDPRRRAQALCNVGIWRAATGELPDAARDLEEALSIFRRLGDRGGQATALANLGTTRRLTADYPAAVRDLQEAVGIHRDIGDRAELGNALGYLGIVREMIADYPGAIRDLEEAAGISRDLGDRFSQANDLAELGVVRRLTGDYRGATRDLEEALGIYSIFGALQGQIIALEALGNVRLITGDVPGASRDLEEALELSHDLGNDRGLANVLTTRARLRRLTGDYPGAAGDLDEALGLYRDLGHRKGLAGALNEAGAVSRTRGAPSEAAGFHQQALELSQQIGSPLDEAQALAGLARCAQADGRAAEADGLLQQALAIFQQIGAAEAAHLPAESDSLTDERPVGGTQSG